MCGKSQTCENESEDIFCDLRDLQNIHCTSDKCVETVCTVPGETCQNGECLCGTETTCLGNKHATKCDTEKGKCVCDVTGYECPEEDSTGGCMVQQDDEFKLHAGCFIASTERLVWKVDNCKKFCNDDAGCKGFALGKPADDFFASYEDGCFMATNRT